MSIPGSALTFLGAASGGDDYQISRSLRFNSDDSAYLDKTFTSAGNRKTWTWSAWIKRTGSAGQFFGAGNGTNDRAHFSFNSNDQIYFFSRNGSSTVRAELHTDAAFSDYSAWYHFIIAFDAGNATAADRIKIYANGVEQSITASTAVANVDHHINNTLGDYIGTRHDTAAFFDGYMAEIHFIDGQALDETSFGEFDDNGVWQPKEFTGSYNFAPPNYASLLTVPGGFASNEGAGNAFDGSTSTRAKASTPDDIITFDLSSLNLTGSFEFWATNAQSEYSLDGGTTWTSSLSSSYTTATSDISGVSNIKFKPSSGTTMKVTAFRNQGNVLVTGVAGVNGYHLDFSDNSSITNGSNAGIGKDVSGNGNYFDSTNIDPKTNITGFNFDSTSTPFTDIGTGLSVTNVNGTSTVTATSNSFNLTTVADFTYTNNASNDNYLRFAASQQVPTSYTIDYYYRLDSQTQASNATVIGIDGERIRDYGSQTSRTIRLKGTNNVHSDYSYTVSANSWNHVRVSPTGIWINGTQLNSSPTNIGGTSGALSIGSNGPNAGFVINGQVGPVRISPKDLGAPPANGLVANSDGTLTTESVGNSGCDSLLDAPTNYDDGTNVGGNYCTWNPLDLSAGAVLTISNGNLDIASDDNNNYSALASFGMTSGKWYWEATCGSLGTYTQASIGINDSHTFNEGYTYYSDNGNKSNNGSSTSYGSSFNTTGTVVGIAFDADAGTLTFYRNGVSQGVAFTADTTRTYRPFYRAAGSTPFSFNFGQRPFEYPPGGTGGPAVTYKSLCTQNLADPPIADGSDYFDIQTYDGTGASQTLPGLSFTADLLWRKCRSADQFHNLVDSVRGLSNALISNEDYNEQSGQSNVSNVTSTGYDIGTEGAINTDEETYVAWAWDAGANSSKTYTVTVVSSAFRFDGHGSAAATLDLEEGSTYVFDQSDSSNANHPLRFATQADAANNSEYTTGVTVTGTPGQAGAKTTITVASGAPTLYYYCSSHNGMGGQINTNSTAGATVLSGSIQKYDKSQTWSDDVSGNAYSASYPVSNAFDGNLETRSVGDTNGLTFTPSSAITVNTSLRIWVDYADSSATNVLVVNGTDYSSLLTVTGYDLGWITIPNISSITSIAYGKAPSGSEKCSISAIEVDGAILVDSGLTPPAVPSITSIVRANPSAGFSIVSWEGNATSGETLAHGLNATPKMVIFKNRDTTSTDWRVYNTMVDGSLDYLFLNKTEGKTDSSLSKPTSTTFTVGSSNESNGDEDAMIAYCFAPVEGYSKFGSYVANADSTGNGPFVFTGFRPRWIMTKHATGTTDTYSAWLIVDTERDTYNVADESLFANMETRQGRRGPGSGSAGPWMDIVSNGFKIRYHGTELNGTDGDTYIYLAFAENPFKSARAR